MTTSPHWLCVPLLFFFKAFFSPLKSTMKIKCPAALFFPHGPRESYIFLETRRPCHPSPVHQRLLGFPTLCQSADPAPPFLNEASGNIYWPVDICCQQHVYLYQSSCLLLLCHPASGATATSSSAASCACLVSN